MLGQTLSFVNTWSCNKISERWWTE